MQAHSSTNTARSSPASPRHLERGLPVYPSAKSILACASWELYLQWNPACRASGDLGIKLASEAFVAADEGSGRRWEAQCGMSQQGVGRGGDGSIPGATVLVLEHIIRLVDQNARVVSSLPHHVLPQWRWAQPPPRLSVTVGSGGADFGSDRQGSCLHHTLQVMGGGLFVVPLRCLPLTRGEVNKRLTLCAPTTVDDSKSRVQSEATWPVPARGAWRF
jgi:hypothetical protein